MQETAEVLKVSPDTVLRDWRFLKAWLRWEMSRRETGSDAGSAPEVSCNERDS
jgi:hypothetical protein